jgi:hypothetical protein
MNKALLHSKIILDLCGGTGAWSKPYKDAGYDVRIITLPEYDVFTWEDYKKPDILPKIYGILAAPDCSHFSRARRKAKVPTDVPGAFKLVARCREIIEYCVLSGNVKFWALENPVGKLRHILGKPSFTFEAWEFGNYWKKKTDVWGFFKHPKKTPCGPLFIDNNFMMDNVYKEIEISADYKIPPGMCKKKIKRAITPPGFAVAFFKANK